MNTNHWSYKHGQTGTDLHNKWREMMKRCYKKYASNYSLYGAKGIGVCESWHEFSCFYEWAKCSGYKDGLSIERKNPELGYCPENCEWIELSENIARSSRRSNYGRNSWIKLSDDDIKVIAERVFAGETQTAVAKDYKIHQSTISKILKGYGE